MDKAVHYFTTFALNASNIHGSRIFTYYKNSEQVKL
jgi:hypothetical protein